MVTPQFIFGFLTAFVIMLVIVIVVGLVMVIKLCKKVAELDRIGGENTEEIYRQLANGVEDFDDKLDKGFKEVDADIDSRIDKLYERIKNKVKI